MAANQDDFFTDLEALQSSQATPPPQQTDFFSDLQALQQPDSKTVPFPAQQEIQQAPTTQVQPEQLQSKTPDFFTDLEPQANAPDFFSDIAEPHPIKTPYDVEPKTPEQLKKMSVSERLQYAQDLATEREYRAARGITKGALSGATLGLSEKIPGLKPEEGEYLTGFGEFLGSALPINKLYNLLGKPLVTLAAKSPVAAEALQSLARMTGFGLTGAAYETGKETIKTGEVPDAEEVAKYGAQWAAFDGALQLAGKAASAFLPKLKSVADANNTSDRQVLNDVMDGLKERKIDIEKDPDKAISTAQEILENYSAKTEVRPTQLKINAEKKPFPASVKEPLIETTGQSARDRIEYPQRGMDKIVDKMNSYIEEAKTPAESLKRRSEAANTAIFNVLAPLEKLEANIPIAQRPSTHIKLAQSAASEINSVLENGIFSNMTGNFEHEGLKAAYGDLTWKKLTKNLKPHEYSLEDLDVYRTSKIALKRQAEGKKTGIDTKQAQKDINRLRGKYEAIDKRIREFQKATLKTYGKDLLGNDLIQQWNKDYYSPLYRVMDSGKDSILSAGSLQPKQPFKKMTGSERKIIPPSESDPYNTAMLVRNARKNDAILQYLELVKEGKLPGKVKAATPNPISEATLDALGLDSEMKQLAEQLYHQTRTHAFIPEKNVLRGWKNGKPFDIEVPEEIYDVFASLNPQDRGPLTKFFGAVNRLFSRGISMEPRKFLSIVSRDALSSLIYSRTGSNPVSVFEALSDVWNSTPVYKEFLSMGGDVYASKLAERIDRTKKIEDLITPGKEGILVPFEKMGDYFRKYSDTLSDISLAVPLAEYKRALEKFGNTTEGRLMAAMEARRVTYDPTRKGGSKIVREMGNYIPFWNVSLQDVSMIGQNLKRPETWMKGMAAITAPTLLLKMANEGNPDYEALTPIDKAAFWHIYSGDKHIRIPIPWLLGTAFKVGAEAFYDTTVDMLNSGDHRAKEAWHGLYENFVENLSGDVPPVLQIYMEQTTGKTAPSPLGLLLGTESRAPEVVPKRLQGLEPKHQYTSKTSQIAKKWGDLWNISPVKVERFIKGLGATSASTLLALTDEIAYFTGLAEDKRSEQREANYLLLGNFVSNSTPSRTKYQNEFYEYLREAEQHKHSKKLIQEARLQESTDELAYASVPLGKYQRQISKLFRQMRSIENSNVTPHEKKIGIDGLQSDVNTLYKQAVQEVRAAKAEKKAA